MVPPPDSREGYKYKQLPPGNWTRVLHLDGASKQETLSGWLEHIDLDTLDSHGKYKPPRYHDKPPARRSSEDLPEYEALSWCWGSGSPNVELRLHEGTSKAWKPIQIPENLATALKSLRKGNVRRTFWVDAICIDLRNKAERAHQVAQMNLVYGRARNVCVWLDESQLGSPYSVATKSIFDFVGKTLLDLTKFDETIRLPANAPLFFAFAQLMTKRWFSRRWVIQEIALARKASIHSGDFEMPWDKFAHAVSLFVKAESVDHQLTKIVEAETVLKAQDAFTDIERMGAVSLVEITTANQHNSGRGILAPTSSLENLMALLPTFEAKKSRDTIYALLAIAKDTTPEAEDAPGGITDHRNAEKRAEEAAQKAWKYVQKFKPAERTRKYLKAQKVATMLTEGLHSKTYTVSYTKDSIDVYKQFVEFCIFQSRSLDVICRPWAPKPDPFKEDDEPTTLEDAETAVSSSESDGEVESSDDEDIGDAPEEFKKGVRSLMLGTQLMSSPTVPQNNYSDVDSSSPPSSTEMPRKKPRQYMSESGAKRKRRHHSQPQTSRHGPPAKKPRPEALVRPSFDRTQEMPSWIADRRNAAFIPSHSEDFARPERHNADPLVGMPDNKPYSASGTRQVRMGKISFLRRTEYDQSLFVEGFVLDTVDQSEEPANLGNIPSQWFTFVDYEAEATQTRGHPPVELYRCLIADRGMKGAKPPLYYMRAYQEVIKNTSITLDIGKAISAGRSVVTEFLERVRQVIYNRQLIKAARPIKQRKDGKDKHRLGLTPKGTRQGDLICILYGLSVPVILRKNDKTKDDKEADERAQLERLPDSYRKAVRAIEKHWTFWKAMKEAIYYLKDDWEEYEEHMDKWRDDIRGKFSKLWLDKIKAEFEMPKALRSDQPVEHPLRLDPNINEAQKKELWESMCARWDSLLKNRRHYPFRSNKFVDRPINEAAPSPDHYYKVIGECYLDGMMDGEALVYKQAKRLEDETFELR